MATETEWGFGPFRLDVANEQLWQDEQALALTPKAFAVLRYLLEHSGQLGTKEALFQAVWADTVVSDAALTVCIRELRQVLGDNPKAPQYIETVHRRGYRFIAPLLLSQPVSSSKFQVSGFRSAIRVPQSAIALVGRATELAQLHGWLDKALAGERQLVFVTGEPGIGKTTLVEAFLDRLGTNGHLWLGRGQCIEHYGAGEAYLPVLAALGRLCREPDGQRFITLLQQHAPTWLVQMPTLLSTAELEALQRKTQGATRECMLRELAEAVEGVTTERGLVLALEDLQWSDVSTLDWLSFIARRREPARLLVLGTYRPVDLIVREHLLKGVKQELQLHGQCAELPLGLLSTEAVGQYLARRFAEGAQDRVPLQGLARAIHRRTDGNPLFMVNVVEYLIARGVLVQSEGGWELQGDIEEIAGRIPESLRQLIERQLERLRAEERRVLEVASVAGAEFSAATIAAGIGTEVEAVEEQCEGLARHGQFLRVHGTAEWPDGTVAARYGFLHALYQEILYERLTPGRRQRLHQQIGEREEKGYGEQAREIAAELAIHFEQGRDYWRAVQYLQHAGENATRRYAYPEAISLLTKGLELLKFLPDTSARAQQELVLQMALNPPLVATKGYAAPEVGKALTQERELCQQVGDTPKLFEVLVGLLTFYLNRAEFQPARELGEQLFTLAQSVQDPAFLRVAHYELGMILFWLGELVPAREHLEQSRAVYDSQKDRSQTSLDRFLASEIPYLPYMAYVLWSLGYPDQALKRTQEAVTLAQELAHPFHLSYALASAARLHQLRREGQAGQERAEAVVVLSSEQGFPFWLALGSMLRGWALAMQGQEEEGIEQIRRGSAAYQAIGQEVGQSWYLAMLVEAYERMGQAAEGLRMLAEALALVEQTGERFYEAELYRLKGELTLQQSSVRGLGSSIQPKQTAKGKGQKESRVPRRASSVHHPRSAIRNPQSEAEAEAEACFQKAIEIARRQSAKTLELRAVMSLSRLWQQQGKTKEARQMLAEIYNWFTEGFDTADLKEAKTLLEELS